MEEMNRTAESTWINEGGRGGMGGYARTKDGNLGEFEWMGNVNCI